MAVLHCAADLFQGNGSVVALTTDDVRAIAHLARLGIDEASLDSVADELTQVLGLVETLQGTPTDHVEPMAHPLSAALRLRDDTVSETDQRDILQAPAPAVQDGYFLVPKVIE